LEAPHNTVLAKTRKRLLRVSGKPGVSNSVNQFS
jgi:hypothetical protein